MRSIKIEKFKVYIIAILIPLVFGTLITNAQSFFTDSENLRHELNQREIGDFTRAYYEKVKIFDAWNEIRNKISTNNLTLSHTIVGIIGANNVLGSNGSLPSGSLQMNGILSGALSENKYKLEAEDIHRSLPSEGLGQVSSIFAALQNVLEEERGVQVINMSFGYPKCSALGFSEEDEINCVDDQEFNTMFDAFKLIFTRHPNVLFATSAGNEDISAVNAVPAVLSTNADVANLITVGATDLNDNRADFGLLRGKSNFGTTVQISAPGKHVHAPAPGTTGSYDKPRIGLFGNITGGFGGTSASTPFVTGVAGLLKAISPDLTPSEIKDILIETGDNIDTDKPIGPRLNAEEAVCHEKALNCQPSGDPSPWPQFQHDARHTGQSQFQGPQTNTLNTKFEAPVPQAEPGILGNISSPAIGSGNTIYYTANSLTQGKLYAVNPDGTLKWDTDILPRSRVTTPAIITDGLAIVVSDFGNEIIALDIQDGEEKWRHNLGNDVTRITKAPDNTLYVMRRGASVVSITPTQDGAIENWSTTLDRRTAGSAPAVGPDGKIYTAVSIDLILGDRTTIHALNPEDGSFAWTKTIDRDTTANRTPVVADDGTVLVAFKNRLRGFNPDTGDIEFTILYPGQRPSVPVILPDGKALVRTDNGWLHFIDLEEEEALTVTGDYLGQPVVDSEGTIYIRKIDNNNELKLEAIKSDRSTLFELDIDEFSRGISNFAIGDNNNLYFTTFFFDDDNFPFSRLNVVGE